MSQAATSIQFEAPILYINGHQIVRLPQEASARLPSRGQVAMVGTINGHGVATVIEPDGRRGHWMRLDRLATTPVSQPEEWVVAQLRTAAEWPEPDIPADLQAALDDAPDVADMWNDVTPMARWEWVRWVQATKRAQTRARRVEVSIEKLRNGKRRPCCFDLSSCTDPEVSTSGKLILA